MAKRENPLDDEDFLEDVATHFVNGVQRQAMADTFGVSTYMVDKWKKSPKVQRKWMQLRDDRVRSTIGRIEKIIAERLEDAEALSTDTLMKLRKEYANDGLRPNAEKADEATIGEMQTMLERQPELAAALEKMLKNE